MVISVLSLNSMLLRVLPTKVLKRDCKGTVRDMTAKTVLYSFLCFSHLKAELQWATISLENHLH